VGGSGLIVPLLLDMLPSVDFDGKAMFKADKVDDEWSDRLLPSESQPSPQGGKEHSTPSAEVWTLICIKFDPHLKR